MFLGCCALQGRTLVLPRPVQQGVNRTALSRMCLSEPASPPLGIYSEDVLRGICEDADHSMIYI